MRGGGGASATVARAQRAASSASAANAPPCRAPPRVLLLDLDGTIVGRVSAIVAEHEALSLALAGGSAAATRMMRASVVDRLKYGTVRPHFDTFCRHATAAGSNVELFLYTASDDRWAAFLVPCLEAAVGVKFNRPIFARKHCVAAGGELRKSIARVLPTVFTRLKKKYGLPNAACLRQRIALIDNTPSVALTDLDATRIVRCPTYDYSYVYDVLGRVDINVMHRRYLRLAAVLERHSLFPASGAAGALLPSSAGALVSRAGQPPASQSSMRFQQFLQLYYARLSEQLGATLAANRAALRDTFWLSLLSALRNAGDSLDEEVIKRINHHIVAGA
jgi:hypothetical protein